MKYIPIAPVQLREDPWLLVLRARAITDLGARWRGLPNGTHIYTTTKGETVRELGYAAAPSR